VTILFFTVCKNTFSLIPSKENLIVRLSLKREPLKLISVSASVPRQREVWLFILVFHW